MGWGTERLRARIRSAQDDVPLNALATLLRRGFRHGVHPDEHKTQTADLPIQRMPFVSRYVLPLQQHVGAPSKPIVAAGDRVRRGQLIGEPGAFVSTTLHSPVTGWVRAVAKRRHPSGHFVPAIEIEADPYATQRLAPAPPVDWPALSIEAFIDAVQAAGIVGLGGGAFPSHVKYSLPEGMRIRHLIINGAECEPYLTNDHRLMVERPDAVLHGAEIVRRKLDAEEAVIGVELNKPDAIRILQAHIQPGQRIRVVPLRVKYPQGEAKMLIKAIYNKEVPAGHHSRDLEMTMNNVGTIVALADYFDAGMPFMERVVTVSGPGIAYPANLIVPLGTPVREVLQFCGGLKTETREVIMGGPMMGTPVASLDVPILKSSSGILAFTEQETGRPQEYPCVRCGRCLEACPYFLNPSQLARLAKARLYQEMKKLQVMECIECGSCTYSCPSGIPIVQLIRSAKNNLHSRKGKSA